ncbi:MAG: DNA recombination protein RmuC, partial [Xanthobacteraceae bacterium]
LREEGDFLRDVVENSARGLRQEMGTALMQATVAHQGLVQGLSDSLLQRTDAFGQRLDRMAATADDRHAALRTMTETRFDQFVAAEAETARDLRAELNGSFQRMRQGVSETLDQASAQQKERLEATQRDLKALAEAQAVAGETLRRTVESRLDLLRQENTLELEKMRATVDEKLQTTLEQRLNESFSRVVEELNKAYTVFGEMKAISSHVGDLKNVLTNPKLRGTFGEVQLAMLLQDFLPPSQYIENAQVREHSGERVEFAIRLPMAEGGEMLLPVDAKFPREDHEHMIAALEAGDVLLAERFRKQLEARIKSFAKDISRKYINPPQTTERAILFLPTESLFAEVLRMRAVRSRPARMQCDACRADHIRRHPACVSGQSPLDGDRRALQRSVEDARRRAPGIRQIQRDRLKGGAAAQLREPVGGGTRNPHARDGPRVEERCNAARRRQHGEGSGVRRVGRRRWPVAGGR